MSTVSRADIAGWAASPASFVREVFGVEPDAWQDEVLAAFPKSPRLAMKACKGLYSPDGADALALTFAQPVAGRQIYTDGAGHPYTLEDREPHYAGPVRRFCLTKYDALAEWDDE